MRYGIQQRYLKMYVYYKMSNNTGLIQDTKITAGLKATCHNRVYIN